MPRFWHPFLLESHSLKVELFFFIEASKSFGNFDSFITWTFINCEGEVRNSATKLFLDFLVPVWEILAFVKQLIVGFEARFHLREGLNHFTGFRISVNVHGEWSSMCADSGLKQVAHVCNLSCVLENVVNILIVADSVSSLIKISYCLIAQTLNMTFPVLLEFLQCNNWFKECTFWILVVLIKLMHSLLN